MSRRGCFAGYELPRAGDRRADSRWLLDALDSASTRFLVIESARSLFRDGADLVVLPAAQAGVGPELLRSAVFLAEEPDGPVFFAIDLTDADPQIRSHLAAGCEWLDIKPLATRLPAREAALLAYARALTHWHRTHRFCGSCGAATRVEQGGHLRVCTRAACARQHFPRTDPAVIMLVTHRDRALLARHPQWPPNSFAPLAGFVEPGESAEAAVAREVDEEVGLTLDGVSYHSSEPWPFPSSIMLAFVARAASTSLRPNPAEIAEARWLTRAQLLRQVEAGELALPSSVSVAHRLVQDWLEGQEATPGRDARG